MAPNGIHRSYLKRNLRLTIHGIEKLLVVERIFEAFLHIGHGFDGSHVGDIVAKNPHTVDGGLVLQEVIAAGAGCYDVDGGEDTLNNEEFLNSMNS